jgi:hypothetical protein
MSARPTSPALHALVAGLVDYAGLFPPAALGMREAAEHYAADRRSPEAWMLGRFVVPGTRLDELATEMGRLLEAGDPPWRLCALVGDDANADAERIAAFNARHAGRVQVDVAEVRAASVEQVTFVTRALANIPAVYVELPHHDDPRPLLEAVAQAGARAKIRTGGVRPDAFPAAAEVARFLVRCAALGVAFKATAGLHHPLRGEHRLTYEADAPSATMFGFLNLFAAGAFARFGATEQQLVQVLEERDATAFAFDADGLAWRGRRLTLGQLEAARGSFAVAFGSCSFREPVDDLRELALL